MDNTRLEAVMVKWPELRPKSTDGFELGLDTATEWEWQSRERGAWQQCVQQEAEALIFRSMVEQLPIDEGMYRNPDGSWNVGGSGKLQVATTAFDALLAFWEART